VIKNLLVERFRKTLVDVPIRRVVINSSEMDLELTNLTLEGTGMVPDNLNIKFTSFSNIQLTKDTDSIQKFKIRLSADHINPRFRGLKFDLDKKSFPALQDHGIADLAFEGRGLCTDVVVEFEFISNQISKAKLTTCSATIEKVTLNIEEQKHNIIGPLFTPVIQTNIRTRIENGVKQFLETKIYQIIKQLNDWFRTRPFETMMRRGNEAIIEAQRNIEELKQRANEGIRDVQRTIEKSTQGQGMTGEKKSSNDDPLNLNQQQGLMGLHDPLNLNQQQGSMGLGHGLNQGEKKSSNDDLLNFNQQQGLMGLHDPLNLNQQQGSMGLHDPLNLNQQQGSMELGHGLNLGDTKSSSGHKSDAMKDVLQEVKQDHDLKHVETDDKSHPVLPRGDELGGKKLSGGNIFDEGKKEGGNTKPMVYDQLLGGLQQPFKEQPSS